MKDAIIMVPNTKYDVVIICSIEPVKFDENSVATKPNTMIKVKQTISEVSFAGMRMPNKKASVPNINMAMS